MATAIQLLRSAVPHLRPDPGVLADGMPMVNLAEESPGLFFRLADGTLTKIGPAHIGSAAPNASPQGHGGNTIGEIWVDTSNTSKISLKFWEGSQWIESTSDTAAISPSPPGAPEGGDLWFDTVNGILQYWDGTQWVPITNTPAAGNNQEVQFNDVGAFGTDPSFKFSSFDKRLTVEKFTANETTVTTGGFNTVNTVDLNAATASLSGALTANGATFSDNVVINADFSAVNGSMTGTLTTAQLSVTTSASVSALSVTGAFTGADGTFSGDLQAGNILINTLPTLP